MPKLERFYMFRGLGNEETSPNIDVICKMAGAIPGIVATAHDWEAYPDVIADIKKLPIMTKRFVAGYSNGAWSASKVAAAEAVDFVFTLDASTWLPPVPIRSTVPAAASIYAVLGSNFDLVGHDYLKLAASNTTTKLTVVRRYGISHGGMQFDPYNIKLIIDAARAQAA